MGRDIPCDQDPDKLTAVVLPARRGAGLLRMVTLAPAGAALATLAWASMPRDYRTPQGSADVVAYSVAFIMALVGATGLAMLYSAVRWLAFCLWPKRLGLRVEGGVLTLALGPFGTRRWPVQELEAVYRFERNPDDDALSTEDYIDPEEEKATRLPLLIPLHQKTPLNRLFERFLSGTEPEQLRTLSPLIDHLRARRQADAARRNALAGSDDSAEGT
jgi:hypothetical protein